MWARYSETLPRRRGRRAPVAALAGALLLSALAVAQGADAAPAGLGPTSRAAQSPASPEIGATSLARHDASPQALRASAEGPRRPPGTLLATVRSGQSLPVRARPGGRTLTRADSSTEFGSRTVLSVARERGHWLAVRSPDLPDGRLGWVDRGSHALSFDRTAYSITADLSRRNVELRRGDRVVERLPVAIGRPGSPTPAGRFAVTDKLDGADYGSYYGCCILALSGHQPNLPAGWQGGDRLAIHGTDAPGAIGTAASAGCLRAADAPLRVLMRRVPVGTPVRIER